MKSGMLVWDVKGGGVAGCGDPSWLNDAHHDNAISPMAGVMSTNSNCIGML